jgi:hypothetical protein
MARKSSTTIRITEQSRQELKDLAAKMRISQAAVMEIAVSRIYQQEINKMDNWTPESLKEKRPYISIIDRGGDKYNGSMINIREHTATLSFGSFNLDAVPLQRIADALNANQPVDLSTI